jgi:hypothetical protein
MTERKFPPPPPPPLPTTAGLPQMAETVAKSSYPCATSELETRFKISKSTRAKRLNQLGLFPEQLHKDGKRFWLTQEQLDLFADFDKYILETGSDEGYPKLYSNRSDRQIELVEDSSVFDELAGELAVQTEALPSPSTAFTGEFTTTGFTVGQASDLLLQQINQNAQGRAAAIMLAEATIANQYLSNPQALDPQLLAQINAIPIPGIDPNALAAKLIGGVQTKLGLATPTI